MCHFAEFSGLLHAYHLLCTFQGPVGYLSKTLVMRGGHLAQTMSEILGKEMDAKGKSVLRRDWGTIDVCLVLLTVRQVEEIFLSRRRLSSLGGQQFRHISCLDRPWAEWQILSITHITISCLCTALGFSLGQWPCCLNNLEPTCLMLARAWKARGVRIDWEQIEG